MRWWCTAMVYTPTHASININERWFDASNVPFLPLNISNSGIKIRKYVSSSNFFPSIRKLDNFELYKEMYVKLILRIVTCQKYRWMVQIDIRKYFENFPQTKKKLSSNFARGSIYLDSNRASISSTPTPRLNRPPPRHSVLRVCIPRWRRESLLN